MNLLDENFPDDQRDLLRKFGVAVRQIGQEEGRFGITDDEIVTLLHGLGQVTFFTHDRDFSGPARCHPAYCLVWLSVRQDFLAEYARRLLRHPKFDTMAKRLGTVLTAGPTGIVVFERHRRTSKRVAWTG